MQKASLLKRISHKIDLRIFFRNLIPSLTPQPIFTKSYNMNAFGFLPEQ